MPDALGALNRKIPAALQEDAARPLDQLARAVGSSKTPVWNRIRKLKERGVMEAHRLAGDIDYIFKVRVADAAAYDAFYRALVTDVSIYNVTSLLSMEQIISKTALPLPA